MDSPEKNATTNLIDITEDITSPITYDYLVSSERSNSKNTSNLNNINTTNKSNKKKSKKVKFSDKVVFIDVECWKKYNEELTADENFTFQNDGENDDNNKNNSQNNDSNKRNKKKDNIVCTCNVI